MIEPIPTPIPKEADPSLEERVTVTVDPAVEEEVIVDPAVEEGITVDLSLEVTVDIIDPAMLV